MPKGGASPEVRSLVEALRAGRPASFVGMLGMCSWERATEVLKPGLYAVADEGTLERLLPGLPEAAWELIEVSDLPVLIEDELGRTVFLETQPEAAFAIRGAGGVCRVHRTGGLPELRVRFDRAGRFRLISG